MKAKRKESTALEPLAEVIERDTRNKRAFDKEFWRFYKQTKKAIRSNMELRDLEVHLEKVKESVLLFAHGPRYGEVMVKLVKPKSWER
jgi:hypothetical protein